MIAGAEAATLDHEVTLCIKATHDEAGGCESGSLICGA